MYDADIWTLQKSRSQMPWKIWNVVLDRDEEDQFDWLCQKWKSIMYHQGRIEYPTYNKAKEG